MFDKKRKREEIMQGFDFQSQTSRENWDGWKPTQEDFSRMSPQIIYKEVIERQRKWLLDELLQCLKIPYPKLSILRLQCPRCGKTMFTHRGYRHHYMEDHILDEY